MARTQPYQILCWTNITVVYHERFKVDSLENESVFHQFLFYILLPLSKCTTCAKSSAKVAAMRKEELTNLFFQQVLDTNKWKCICGITGEKNHGQSDLLSHLCSQQIIIIGGNVEVQVHGFACAYEFPSCSPVNFRAGAESSTVYLYVQRACDCTLTVY